MILKTNFDNFRCGILQSELKLEIQCKEEPSKGKYVKKKPQKLLDKVEDECLVLHFVSFYQIHVSVVD